MAARITHNFSNAGADSYNNAMASILAAQAQANAMSQAAQAQAAGNVGAASASAGGAVGAANQQGLSGLGNAYAGAYGGYASGLGNVAQAMANERSNFYGANAMAEAARQAAAGNIGSSALGAFGGGLNSALGAWGTNQAAYNQALAGMQSANQMGLSQYGQSRNAALGQLANPYSALGRGMIAGDVAGQLAGAIGGGGAGGGFSATGTAGPIASGSFSPTPGGAVAPPRPGGATAAGALQGLNDLRASVMQGDVMDRMGASNDSAMQALNAQHFSSRGMPMQMLRGAAGTIGSLAGQAYGQLGGGMNQFYGTMNNPQNRVDYSGVLGRLTSGYGNANASIGTLPGWISAGMNSFGPSRPTMTPYSAGGSSSPFESRRPARRM